MLELYTATYCPFCRKVEAFLDENNIPYEEHDVSKSQEDRDIIVNEGGKMQIPYLRDTTRKEHMYESDSIIAYIERHYGTDASQNHEAA